MSKNQKADTLKRLASLQAFMAKKSAPKASATKKARATSAPKPTRRTPSPARRTRRAASVPAQVRQMINAPVSLAAAQQAGPFYGPVTRPAGYVQPVQVAKPKAAQLPFAAALRAKAIKMHQARDVKGAPVAGPTSSEQLAKLRAQLAAFAPHAGQSAQDAKIRKSQLSLALRKLQAAQKAQKERLAKRGLKQFIQERAKKFAPAAVQQDMSGFAQLKERMKAQQQRQKAISALMNVQRLPGESDSSYKLRASEARARAKMLERAPLRLPQAPLQQDPRIIKNLAAVKPAARQMTQSLLTPGTYVPLRSHEQTASQRAQRLGKEFGFEADKPKKQQKKQQKQQGWAVFPPAPPAPTMPALLPPPPAPLPPGYKPKPTAQKQQDQLARKIAAILKGPHGGPLLPGSIPPPPPPPPKMKGGFWF